MTTATSLDRIGVGIDTARYGHRVSFLRPDRQQAAKPLTVTENRAGYQALKDRLNQLHQQHPQARFHVRMVPFGQSRGPRLVDEFYLAFRIKGRMALKSTGVTRK